MYYAYNHIVEVVQCDTNVKTEPSQKGKQRRPCLTLKEDDESSSGITVGASRSSKRKRT
jgi:hypothetical protein